MQQQQQQQQQPNETTTTTTQQQQQQQPTNETAIASIGETHRLKKTRPKLSESNETVDNQTRCGDALKLFLSLSNERLTPPSPARFRHMAGDGLTCVDVVSNSRSFGARPAKALACPLEAAASNARAARPPAEYLTTPSKPPTVWRTRKSSGGGGGNDDAFPAADVES
jgi:hypothetical protein